VVEALDEVARTLLLLREDFNREVARTDAELADLARHLDGLDAKLEKELAAPRPVPAQPVTQAAAPRGAEPGFVRRLFGASGAREK